MNRSLFLAYLVGFSIAKAQIPICDGHPGNPHAAGLLSGSDSLASCSHQANNQGGFTTNITIDANTIITWESLVNSAQDSLNFFQEDGTGSVLNVIEGTRSVLLGGTIYADGAVGFLAPNLGIGSVLEVDGEISAAELTIATHDLDAPSRANWFSGGSLLFENTAQFDQAINTSGGPIEARDGSLLLVAEDIFNGASLTALNGSVLLAAGQQVKVAQDSGAQVATISTAEPSGTGHVISNTAPKIRAETISLNAADQLQNRPGSQLESTLPVSGRIFLQVNGETNQIQVDPNDLTGQVSFNGVVVESILFDPSDASNPNGRSATISRFPRLDELPKAEDSSQVVVSNVPSVSSPKLKEKPPVTATPQQEASTSPEKQRKSYYRGQSFFGLRGSSQKKPTPSESTR